MFYINKYLASIALSQIWLRILSKQSPNHHVELSFTYASAGCQCVHLPFLTFGHENLMLSPSQTKLCSQCQWWYKINPIQHRRLWTVPGIKIGLLRCNIIKESFTWKRKGSQPARTVKQYPNTILYGGKKGEICFHQLSSTTHISSSAGFHY